MCVCVCVCMCEYVSHTGRRGSVLIESKPDPKQRGCKATQSNPTQPTKGTQPNQRNLETLAVPPKGLSICFHDATNVRGDVAVATKSEVHTNVSVGFKIETNDQV